MMIMVRKKNSKLYVMKISTTIFRLITFFQAWGKNTTSGWRNFCLCCSRFISVIDDTKSTIPATRRLVFNFWVVHSVKYQVRKAFESVIEMGNLWSAVVENVAVETGDLKRFRCCWQNGLSRRVVLTVRGKIYTFHIGYEWMAEHDLMLMSNL